MATRRRTLENDPVTDAPADVDAPGANDDLAAQLARFPEVARIGRAVYTADGLRLFLTTPSPRFGGRTGLHLLRAGDSDRVISVLAADYEGLS
jgi:hypothetical protein